MSMGFASRVRTSRLRRARVNTRGHGVRPLGRTGSHGERRRRERWMMRHRGSAIRLCHNGLRKQVKSFKQRIRRSIRTLSRSVDRARKQLSVRCVTAKRIYTTEARKLARIMVDSGCARGKVGPGMERIGTVFGIHINRVMSRRTVGRAVEEGVVAAKMQVAFELSSSKGVTISADSTSNRGIHIESPHMALRVPDYTSGNLESKN
ncbi:hypothetical protein B0H19DRAFT_1079548 [Mycena capillaripes]|nr:hypothetical protein B0H19DRAFT_1079548 [Mycena capillaripes]